MPLTYQGAKPMSVERDRPASEADAARVLTDRRVHDALVEEIRSWLKGTEVEGLVELQVSGTIQYGLESILHHWTETHTE